MSYLNKIYGDIRPFNFFSRDPINEEELRIYFNEIFVENDILNFVKDLNIGYHILVYSENSIGVTFYLTNKETTTDNIRDYLDTSMAQIQTHIDKEDNEFTIKWISVSEDSRGKKYAQFLIYLSLLYTKILHGTVNKAMLDDDTDNYANGIEDPSKRRRAQSKNIYCKMGYVYEDETGGPEMIGDISDLIDKNSNIFTNKRKKSGSKIKTKKNKKKKKKNKKLKRK